ncbi:MAG: M14 family zinc carboxypeptidase [Promethearchaeota archaeon]
MSLGPTSEVLWPIAKPAPFAYDRSFQKSPGTVTWIWDQYSDAPGPMQGDDVLHWGPTLGPYHNYTEVLAHIGDRLTDFSELIDVFTIGVSYNGLSIPCIQITAPGDTSQRQGFLIVAHHHGREAITVENALYFVDYLLAYFDDPEVQRILEHFVLYIIPTLNPDVLGMLHINPWQRKNLHPTDEDGDGLADEWEVQDVNGDFTIAFFENPDEYYYTYEGIDLDGDGETGEDLPGGIDLNRNYPVAFSAGSSDPRSEVYHGTTSFSEPETQAMLNFTVHHHQNLAFGVSLHSGTDVLLTPWCHTSEPSYHEPFFANLGAAVQAASGFEWWSATQLYPSYGTWDDWLYGEYDIPAVTLEVYGNESAWGYSIWDYFNPSADQVLANCEKVRDAIFAMAEVLLDEPGEPLIIVPSVVSSGVSTLVSVYIDQSLSGFDLLFLEYRFDPMHNHNWVGVPLIYQGGNRYNVFVPAPIMDGLMELHVYGRDFAGHTIYSDSILYTISTAFFFGQIIAVIVVAIVVVVIVILVMRRRRRHHGT